MSTHRPVKVEKNSVIVGNRNRLNLIEGTNVVLTVTDDSANDEIDVEIESTVSGTGGFGTKVSTTAALQTAINNSSIHLIYLDPDYDGDGDTVTIARSNLTISTGLSEARDTWAVPRIDKIIVDSTVADIKSVVIEGLSMRELHIDAIDHVIYDLNVRSCQFNVYSATDPNLYGIVFDGSGAGYWYMIRFLNCHIHDAYNQTTGGRDLGTITVLSANDGCGQVWFDNLDYRGIVDGTCMLAYDTNAVSGPTMWFNECNLNPFGTHKFFYAKDGSNVSSLKVTNNWIEAHDPATIYTIVGNGAGGNQNFTSQFSENFVSVGGSAGEVLTFITNTMTTGDTIGYRPSGVWGEDNIFSATGADMTFVEGTLGETTEFEFKVHYRYFYGTTRYGTDKSGTATLLSGQTNVHVTHLLTYTPTLGQIKIVWGENPTNAIADWWINGISSTEFVLNGADPGASNLDFGWSIQRI